MEPLAHPVPNHGVQAWVFCLLSKEEVVCRINRKIEEQLKL